VTIEDIQLSGVEPDDPAIRRMELGFDHCVAGRRFLLDRLPQGSVGVELGVYTGLFSSLLAAEAKFTRVTFVDPWWLLFGRNYPAAWGSYTDEGRVETHAAWRQAVARINRAGLPNRIIEVTHSQLWLKEQPDASLDWAYIDSEHSYPPKIEELNLLDRKLGANGIIIGDDWWIDEIFTAVNDFIRSHDFDLIFADMHGPSQWMLRRSYKRRRVQFNDLRSDLNLATTWEMARHKPSY